MNVYRFWLVAKNNVRCWQICNGRSYVKFIQYIHENHNLRTQTLAELIDIRKKSVNHILHEPFDMQFLHFSPGLWASTICFVCEDLFDNQPDVYLFDLYLFQNIIFELST